MSVFSSVLGNKVGRSVFDLSHVKRFTCDMGQLIPVYFDECVPGDTRKIGMQCVTRFQPMVAPILDSVDLTVHYFFVPTRLLMDKKEDWNTFLTGGKDGTDDTIILPTWSFTDVNSPFSNRKADGKYSLWDYFGLPLTSDNFKVRNVNHVLGFPQRCYNLVWNEFYRDQNVVDEVPINNSTVLYRAWKKDYFTSALPWQQRGIAPALPLSGTVPVSFANPVVMDSFKLGTSGGIYDNLEAGAFDSSTKYQSVGFNSPVNAPVFTPGNSLDVAYANIGASATVDLSNAATFNVATLRQCVQIQRWLELNARGGVRYR